MKIIECPRDAMQGIHDFIPTELKAAYINLLLKVGFDTIDFGSFVSPKAIPQLRDTAEVLEQLDLDTTQSKLLAIIANVRGAETAAGFEAIDYLGFPLSISEEFQKRNTNKSIEEALVALAEIQNVCKKSNKTLVTYISMGFGNPYGEPYNEEIVSEFVQKLVDLDVEIISLADTIGAADPETISRVFKKSIADNPDIEFGAHFHSTPEATLEKLEAAYSVGCTRFDSAVKGFGGCPMADDDLVGNVATERLIDFLKQKGVNLGYQEQAFDQAMLKSVSVFPN